jgi:hypothetical protein
MEILSFEGGAQAPRKKKPLGFILGIALIAGATTLGSTLAASVTIGSAPITFGQGVVQAVACDSEITVTPVASFVNATGAGGAFRLGSITVAGLNNAATNATTGVGCGGKTLVIKVWDDAGATPLTLATTAGSAITSPINATIGSTTANDGVTVSSSGAGSLTYTIGSPTLNATSIFKITVEQQNA